MAAEAVKTKMFFKEEAAKAIKQRQIFITQGAHPIYTYKTLRGGDLPKPLTTELRQKLKACSRKILSTDGQVLLPYTILPVHTEEQ